MPSKVPYTLALAGFVLTASLVVLGQTDDPCITITDCRKCVTTQLNESVRNHTQGNNGTCIWEVTSGGQRCSDSYSPSEQIQGVYYAAELCDTIPTTAAPPAPNTTTTAPPTTSSTTTAPTTAPTTTVPTTTPNSTTTSTTSTTPAPTTTTAPTNSTTTAQPTPTPSPTTPSPSNSTTTAAPKPAPAKGGFSWASFIGGIVFAAALSSVAFLIWRFYKVRLDRNYHTL